MCKLYWTYLWERVNNPVMAHVQNLSKHNQKIVVVGAGIGGLAAALRLSALGHKVQVIETAPTPGGKIRTLSGANNPIDLGPTVLTLLPVFERLFSDIGEKAAVSIASEPWSFPRTKVHVLYMPIHQKGR